MIGPVPEARDRMLYVRAAMTSMTSPRSRRPRSRCGFRSATLVALLTGLLLLTTACTGGSSGSGAGAEDTAEESTTTAAPTTTIDPATLPQTEEKPTTTGAAFQDRMAALGDAIIADDSSLALGSFFPVEAYKQVKKLSDPASDWKNRLIAELKVDTHDAHNQLGAGAANATYLGVDVPDAAVWVKPGEEYNLIGYWRVYGTKLRFDVGGTTKVIPVSSLISWRGQWYLVHLGAIR